MDVRLFSRLKNVAAIHVLTGNCMFVSGTQVVKVGMNFGLFGSK